MDEYNSRQFLLDDLPGTLFPLRTSIVLATHAFDQILEHVYQHVLKVDDKEHHFLNQIRCYSSKHGFHVRRTMRLDPVAETFIYDLIYRNRLTFRRDHAEHRRSFGYRFEAGRPVSVSDAYSAFRSAVAEARAAYKFSARCDIASYFNSIYQHDLVQWFRDEGRSEDDVVAFGQLLRETNAGRSVDCLPQGVYPAKIVGAEYLKFIDNAIRLRSAVFLRFMDDMYWFDNDEGTVLADFVLIQRMLGERGLSINSAKTDIGAATVANIPKQLDEIKASLLQIRRRLIDVSDFEYEEEELQEVDLSTDQTDYLLRLLRDPETTEQDAELVLSLLRDRGADVLERMGSFLERFPSLGRNLYAYCRFVGEKERLATVVLEFLTRSRHVTEDQLFWLAKIGERYLIETKQVRDILRRLYEDPNATSITQAKILEIPELRFGLPELRHEVLRTGFSDWRTWAAAVGCSAEAPGQRNHLLGYFANGGPINRLICDCIRELKEA